MDDSAKPRQEVASSRSLGTLVDWNFRVDTEADSDEESVSDEQSVSDGRWVTDSQNEDLSDSENDSNFPVEDQDEPAGGECRGGKSNPWPPGRTGLPFPNIF